MPWERGGGFAADMFGLLDENPLVRRARELASDEAIADEQFKADNGAYPPNFPPNILQAPGTRGLPRLPYVKSGSTVLLPDEQGNLNVAYQEPDNTQQVVAAKTLDYLRKLETSILGTPGALRSKEDNDRLLKVQNEIENLSTPQSGLTGLTPPGARPAGIGFMGTLGGTNAFDAGVDKIINTRIAPPAEAPIVGGLTVGEVRKGYRYKGGNPANKTSWEKQ